MRPSQLRNSAANRCIYPNRYVPPVIATSLVAIGVLTMGTSSEVGIGSGARRASGDGVQALGDQLLDQLSPGRLSSIITPLAAKAWHCLRTARFNFGYSMGRRSTCNR